MEDNITTTVISATVSITVVAVSRWVFSRSDRRFPILVLIQEELLKIQKDPPWSTNGGNVHFEKIRETTKRLQPYFDRLRMVSFPRRNCSVQKAWSKFKNIREDDWNAAHSNREQKYDSLTKEEFLAEVTKVLNAISNA